MTCGFACDGASQIGWKRFIPVQGHRSAHKKEPIKSVLGDMPRYLVFGDIEGKLDVLRVECTKCDRKGRYSVVILIDKYGRTGDVMKWKEQLNGDCPKRDGPPE